MKNLILPILLLVSGCGSTIEVDSRAYSHMISLDKNGETFDIEIIKDSTADTHKDYARELKSCKDKDSCKNDILIVQLKAIREELKEFYNKEEPSHVTKEVMIVIHGGLISKRKSAEEATVLHDAILSDNQECRSRTSKLGCKIIYSIFINWESGMGAAYSDHLFNVRQGKEAPFLGPLTSPFYLFADVGRAITRLPITYTYQAYDALRKNNIAKENDVSDINCRFYTPRRKDGKDIDCAPYSHHKNGGTISLGQDNVSDTKRFLDKATYIFPGVFKLVTTPVLDTVGKSAWGNMLRRTKTVFRTPDDYHGQFSNVEFGDNGYGVRRIFSKQETGGVSRLLRTINKLNSETNNKDIAYTLVGHSMGAITSSRLLGKLLENGRYEHLSFDNIVFMAAASTIRQFEDNVVPYLEKNKDAKFYNLTLHPYTEENEQTGLDSVPRGSLLVWIDNYVADPGSNADHTLGKWNNYLGVLPFIPESVRHRISVKGFGVNDRLVNRPGPKGKSNKPQKHGQFNDVDQCFWRKEYWLPFDEKAPYKPCG